MSNKTYLVARREFFDMARTKTFWLGILLFPFIWAIAIVVPTLLDKAKSVREFSIIDKSEGKWISNYLKSKTEFPSLLKVMEEVVRRKDANDAYDELPAFLKSESFTKDARKFVASKPDSGERKLIAAIEERYLEYVEGASRLESIPETALDGDATKAAIFEQAAKLLADKLGKQAEFEKHRAQGTKELFGWVKDEILWPARAVEWWRGLPKGEKTALARDAKASASFRLVDHGENELDLSEEELSALEESLGKRVGEGKLFAYFFVPENPVGLKPANAAARAAANKERTSKDAKAAAENKSDSDQRPAAQRLARPAFKYVTRQENLADTDLKRWFERHAGALLRERRTANLGIAQSDADWLSSDVFWEEKRATETGKEEKVERADKFLQFAPIAFVYLLFITILTSASFLLTNTVEEKSNRIIEVLLSSVSPQQLMVGKTLGLAATGLVMVASWIFFAILGVKLAPLFGESFVVTIGRLGLDKIVSNPRLLISFVVYFVSGYLLYAALLAGIGAVCNSLKEAQSLMQPVVIFMILPFLATMAIAQEPNGTLARIVTYTPFFTPFAMMGRAGGPPPAIEYILSSALILLTMWFTFKAAGKVFRIGILMTGKRPSVREIWGWLWQPEGAVPVRKEA